MASPFAEGGGKDQLHKSSFRAEDVEIDLGGIQGDGALVQSVQFTCNRTVNFLYEIGSANVYYTGNRRQGQCQCTRVVGGTGDFKALLKKYGNMCEPADLVFNAKAGCGESQATKYTCKFATLNSIGASRTAQEVTINEQLGFVFSDLDVT